MAFMKFSKGKPLISIPNGLGDGSAYFSQTEGIIANVDNLPYGNSARSISCWICNTYRNTEDSDTFFSYGIDNSNQRFGIGIRGAENSINVWGHGNTTTYNYTFNLKQWYHAVITFADDYTEKCYIDGVLIGTQTHSNINTQKGSGTVGRSTYNSGMRDWFYGNIKELNVYNRVLSTEEVTQLYNKQKITSGRVLYIPLQYGKDNDSIFSSKNFVYDYATLTTSSGFDEFGYPIRYDVASECGISYSTIPTDNLILYMALKDNQTSPEVVDSDVFTTNYEGNYNSANYQVVDNVPCLYLDSNSNITLTRGNKEIRQATFAYWGKFNDSSQCIITNSYDTSACVNGGAEFWLAFSATNAYFTSGSHLGNIIFVDIAISPEWHHIAVTWDMDTNYMYLYLDGVLIGECTDQSWLAPNINRSGFILSVNNLYRASSVIYGNGNYSSVRMYDRVLTAREIKALAREF